MKLKYYFFIGLLTIAGLVSISGCESSRTDEPLEDTKVQKVITHYYSLTMKNGVAMPDTLKDCFSCNQALIYDKGGKEKALVFYKDNMEDEFGREEYIYDIKGRKIGSNYFEGDSLTVKHIFEVDSVDTTRILAGLAVESATQRPLYGYRYQYDGNDNQYETANMNEINEVFEFYRRKYNGHGVVTSENIVDLKGNSTFSIRYEYRPDATKDWVEQLTYYNDVLSEIRVRERVPW